MSTRLAEYTSSRNPGKKYYIIRGDDGVVYCNCPGWRFRKDCKHLRDYNKFNVAISNKPDIMSKLKGVYNE